MPGNTGIPLYMDELSKHLDEHNTKMLYGILSESGIEGLTNWFSEQELERQEYVLELLGRMMHDLIHAKSSFNEQLTNKYKPKAEVIPLRRKPKFTVIK